MLRVILVCCLLALVHLLPAVEDDALWRFDGTEAWRLQGAAGVTLAATGSGLRLDLPPSEVPLEVVLTEPTWCEARSFASLDAIRQPYRVLAGAGHEIGINLVDAEGEGLTLHPRLLAGDGAAEWTVPGDVVWSWRHGGSQAATDREPDGVLRLLGLFIKRPPAAAPTSLLLLPARGRHRPGGDDPAYHFAREAWTFAPEEGWAVSEQRGEPAARLSAVAGGLEIVLPPAAGRQQVTIGSTELERHGFLGDCRGLALALETEGADGVELGINLADEDGEGFSLATRSLEEGRASLRWSLPGSIVHSWGRFGRDRSKNGRVDGRLRPLGIFLRRAGGGGAARIVLRRGVAEQPVWNHVLAGVETGDPLRILRPGTEDRLALRFANPLERPLAIRFAGAIEDFDGARRPLTIERRLEPASRVLVPIPTEVLGPARGIKWLDYELTVDGHAVSAQRESFAYLDPPGPAPRPERIGDGFWFCVHQDFWRWRDGVDQAGIRIAALAGANAIRGGAEWDRTNPEPGVYDWIQFDAAVAAAAAEGLELFASLWGTPRWAAARSEKPEAAKWWSRVAPRPDAMEAWARAVGERYRGRIRLWELSNEPDYGSLFYVGSHQELVAAQRAAHRGLHAVDPEAIVMTSGFAKAKSAESKRSAEKGHIHERVIVDAAGAYDLHNVHLHGPFPEFIEAVDGELARIRSLVAEPTPLWFGETAQPARGGLRSSERRQAETLVKKLGFAWSRGAVGYTWFHIWDDTDWNAADDWQDMAWGLYTDAGQPKAVWCAHAVLSRLLRGGRYLGQLELGPGRWGFVFAVGDHRVLLHWTEDQAQADQVVVLEVPGATAVRGLDIMGNPADATLAGGKLALPLGQAVGYTVIEGGTGVPAVATPLIAATAVPVVAPGEATLLTLALHDPFDHALELELAWSLRGRVEAPHAVELQPGAATTVVAELHPAVDEAVPMVVLEYRQRGGDLAGRLHLPLRRGTVIDRRGPEERGPAFVLENAAQVVNENTFMMGDEVEALRWSGPRDLAARVWAWVADDALCLRVDVADDHHAPATGDEAPTHGDALRLVLQDPAAAYRGWWELVVAGAPGSESLQVVHHDFYASGAGLEDQAGLRAQVIPGGRRYDLTLPLAALRMDPSSLRRGLRCNLQVIDRDAGGREGWIQLAPGIADEGPKETAGYPVLLLRGDAP